MNCRAWLGAGPGRGPACVDGGQVGFGWDWSIGDAFVSIDYLVAVGRNHERLEVTGGTAATSQADGTVFLGPNRALLVAPSNVGTTTGNARSFRS